MVEKSDIDPDPISRSGITCKVGSRSINDLFGPDTLVDGELTSCEDGGAGGVHALYDVVVELHLVLGPLDDVLVHAGLRHQPATRRKPIY